MSTDKHEKCIELKGVSFNHNSTIVLDNISFSIEHGDYVGILGANGSGKTTLLKVILGLIEPSFGTVKLFGKPVSESEELHNIGYVPQRASQIDWDYPATVEEIVTSGRTARLGLFKRLGTEDRKEIEQAMKTTEVIGLRKRMIGHLSGGERQRVFIARALAGDPHVLVLDEPTANIDSASEHAFYEFLEKLNEQEEITIILVSHDIDSVTKQVKTILCLNRELVCHLPAGEFITKHHLEQMYGKRSQHILHKHEHDDSSGHSDHNHYKK